MMPQASAPACAGQAIRVMLVDDHKTMLWGLEKLIEGTPEMSLVGSAGDAETALAMAAAQQRRTRGGHTLGADERLDAAAVLRLYGSSAQRPGGECRQLQVGAVADLCVLDRGWDAMSEDFAAVRVRLTLGRGRVLHAA